MAERIEDYALIGDCLTCALVSRGRSIDWMCLPIFDSPACFAALLGRPEHGRWLLAPRDGEPAGRRYRGGTLVLETDFCTPTGEVTVVDCMPPQPRRGRGAPGRRPPRHGGDAGGAGGAVRLRLDRPVAAAHRRRAAGGGGRAGRGRAGRPGRGPLRRADGGRGVRGVGRAEGTVRAGVPPLARAAAGAAGTVEAVRRELAHDGLAHRYPTRTGVDGLPPGEGTFLACSFWLADCVALMGRRGEARELFERLLNVCNDVGLLAEEYDPHARRLLGNFPQAFSHIGLVNTAWNLSRDGGPAEHRKSG